MGGLPQLLNDGQPQRITLRLSDLYVCAFADSSGGRVGAGRRSSQRSRSAIAVAAQDELEHVFFLKMWIKHCTTDELIEEVFLTQEQWKPKIFGIDATATQTLFADALRREAREKSKKLPLYDHIFTGDKDFRIETHLQPLQAAGKLFTCMQGMDDFQHEYESFPGGHFKDGLDAAVGCILLFPRRPKPEETRTEMRQYRTYLEGVMKVDPLESARQAAAAYRQAVAERRERGGYRQWTERPDSRKT
jgi:hypothetical protein